MVGRGITPLGRHRQREQFARAVEVLPEDGGPTLDATDPELARDLAVVGLLRRAAETSGPDAETKERMRLRILAADPPKVSVLESRAPQRFGARGRLAVASAAALCLILSLAGMSLLLSRDALPGDALYGVKRSAESASLGFTFGSESKALKRLEFASARISEMETLVDRYRESGGGPLGGYLSALTDFDADAAAGSRELATVGANSDQRVLGSLRDWADVHTTRLTELRGKLPEQAANRSAVSLDLLDRMSKRAAALMARTNCSPITSGQADDVGPLPAEGTCAPTPIDPSGSANTLTPTSGLPGKPVQPTTPGQSTTNPVPGSNQATTPETPVLPLPLPPIASSILPTTPGGLLPPISIPPLLPGLPGIRVGI